MPYSITTDAAGNTIITFQAPGIVTPEGLTILVITIAPGAQGVAIDQPAVDAITERLQGG